MQEPKNHIIWTLQLLRVADLKNHPKNPRQIGKQQFERLGKLIDKFGLIDKPILNYDLTIIGGHQRIKYLKKIKEKSVECWVADRQLTESEIDELCIGLNLHQGQWDYDLLADQWNPIDLLEYGFTEEQLLGITQVDDDDEEKPQRKQKTATICPSCGHEF